MRNLPQATAGFLLCILMLCLCYGGAPVMGDPDTAWHLATGDLIRSLGDIPSADSWSFTAGSEKWYNLSWLFDAGFSLLFGIAGFSGIFALTVFVFALAITLMAQHCIRRGASPSAACITALLALFVLYVGALARPHMFSTLFTVLFYLGLQRYRSSGNLRDLLWLPPLMALWVNLHGGFIFAFFLIGLFCLGAMVNGNAKQRRDYALTFALCLIATLINPYGLEVYFGAYKTLSGAFDQTFVLEWKPIEIGKHLPMTLLLFVILFAGDATDRRISLVDRALSIIVLLLALSSIRHAVIATLLIMPYLSQRLTFVLQASPFGTRVRAIDDTITADMRKDDIRILASVMAVAAFVLVASPFPRDALLKEPVGFPRNHYPAESAAFISQHYPHLRFFNDYNIGGYLVYIWRGSTKVFIDGRASSLFSKELLHDYPDFAYSAGFGPRSKLIAGYYGLEGLIILNDDANADDWVWNPQWKRVHSDAVATVYVKSDLVAQPSSPSAAHARKPTLMQKIKRALSR